MFVVIPSAIATLGIPPRWFSVDEWKRGCGTCTQWIITQPRERKRKNITNKDYTGYSKMGGPGDHPEK